MKLILLILVLKSVESKSVDTSGVIVDTKPVENNEPPKAPDFGRSNTYRTNEDNEKLERTNFHNPHAKQINSREGTALKLRQMNSRTDPGLKTRSTKQERGDEFKNKRDELKQQKRVLTMEEAKDFNMKGVEETCTLSHEEEIETLAVHRMYRHKESTSATNMWRMGWDGKLANLAQGLVNTCVFKHTNLEFADGKRVGQNLAAVTSTTDHSIDRIVRLFYDEKDNYDFDNNKANGVVGHYLQVVFWESVKVGCAYKFCEELFVTTTSEIFKNAWFWACDYSPPSTSLTRPYDKGDACSQCVVPAFDVEKGKGVKCVDNTCLECTLEQDEECKPSKPCTSHPDKDQNCDYCTYFNWCLPSSEYYEWAKTNCQTTCKLCDFTPDFGYEP